MTYDRPALRSTTSVEAMLNTLEHEKHARGAVLGAFVEELRIALHDRVPESTRDLLARAERLADVEVGLLVEEIRLLVRSGGLNAAADAGRGPAPR